MRSVLFVTTMNLGDELQVREIHHQFPSAVLANDAGVERVRAYIGSGHYALELGVNDGDFQEAFARFTSTPAVMEFFDALRPYVQDLPIPGQETASLPLAAPILDWV
jgi:hypothetical protein